MKALILTRYGRQGASSRMRSYQYLPWLAAAGIDVEVSPLFSDTYVADLQRGKKNWHESIVAYSLRLRRLLNTQHFDLVWIEKEMLPWLPIWVEQVLLPKRIPYVLDYDDAVFHNYDQSNNFFVKWLLTDKHPALMRNAALVVTGNQYLADFAQLAGAKNIEIVPTVIDLDRYPAFVQKPETHETTPLYVGWIGQRSTAHFLEPYKQLFNQLLSTGKVGFVAIGIDAQALDLPMKSIPWTAQTEANSIASFDIGIMPLVDEPFVRGKCGYKLIQYMACGLPVVASPVGVNSQLVEHGVNGFLAETVEQWQNFLQILLEDSELRKQMGMAGRQKIEQQYCIQITGSKLAALLINIAANYRPNKNGVK